MPVESRALTLQTHKEGELVDITAKVEAAIRAGRIENGVAFLFVPGSTGALTTIEYEPGLAMDFPKALEKLAPAGLSYEHEERWHDGNGHSHVKASLLGPGLFVPFQKKKLMLGTWQQVVFVELDVRPRSRTVIVQVIGE